MVRRGGRREDRKDGGGRLDGIWIHGGVVVMEVRWTTWSLL